MGCLCCSVKHRVPGTAEQGILTSTEEPWEGALQSIENHFCFAKRRAVWLSRALQMNTAASYVAGSHLAGAVISLFPVSDG